MLNHQFAEQENNICLEIGSLIICTEFIIPMFLRTIELDDTPSPLFKVCELTMVKPTSVNYIPHGEPNPVYSKHSHLVPCTKAHFFKA